MKSSKWPSIRALCLTCMCLLIGATAQAQTVNRPEIKVGDRWKFEQRDTLTNLVSANKELIVTNVDDNRIELTENGLPSILSVDMNPIDTPEARFEPTAAALRFPFAIGDKWSWDGKVYIKSAALTALNQYEVKVAGEEKITVRGGTFDTWKLVMSGYININSNSRPFTRTYWYAPQARGFVKILNEDRRNPWVMELLEHSLTP